MKKAAILSVLLVGFAGLFTTVPALADSVIYDNTGPTSGTGDGWNFSAGYVITDSFTLTNGAVVNGATFLVDLDIYPSSVTGVDWAITTQPFGGTTLVSGMATDTTMESQLITYHYPSGIISHYAIEETIQFSGLTLGPGTYWFQLSNATDDVPYGGIWIGWDGSGGPSTAYQSEVGIGTNVIPSDTFQMLGENGEPPVVPEPSSWLLLCSGLAGLAGVVQRKMRA
jgi:hypothetical protein